MRLLPRLEFLFRTRDRRDRELDEEIRSHFQMAVEDRVARGERRDEALRAVRREFGDPARVKEITRAMWPGAWLDRFRQDLRFGARSFRRDRAFAWAAVIVLTIGIGANATVFTLMNGVFYKDAPGITEPDDLVGVRWIEPGAQGADREVSWSHPDYAYLRREMTVFAGLFAYLPSPIRVTTSEEAGFQADAWVVSDNFFDVLGTEMAIGRGFVPEEGQTLGTHPVVVIGHAYWESRLAADPTVVGNTISLNGTPFTVVGITAPQFRGISPIETPPDLYVPVMMQGAINLGNDAWFERVDSTYSGWLRLVARLPEGATVANAQARLDGIQAGWREAFGGWWASLQRPDFRMVITPEYKLNMQSSQRLEQMLGYLAMIALAILIIGSANVTILLLARGTARRGEMGVRAALGAGRARLFAQLLVESLIPAALGSIGGIIVAYLAVRVVVPLLPYEFPFTLAPDATVVAFTGAVTLMVTILFGVVPSARVSRAGSGLTQRQTARVTAANGFRNALVVGQMAAAVVLVVGAGLFVRSIVAAQSIDPGFEPEGRLTMVAALADGYDDQRGIAFMNEALDRARALPGVQQATVAARVPFSGGRSDEGVSVPGTRSAQTRSVLNFNWIGPDYFEGMGIPVVAGRAIDARDDREALRVLMVNETTAAQLWPGENAVGRTIIRQGEVWTVVGVAADANYYALGEPPLSQVYVPLAQDFVPYLTFVLEAEVPPASLSRALESVIWDIDPGLTVFDAQTLEDLVDAQSSSYRLLAVVGTAFGLVALFLAIAGLYGVQSYLVSQRFKEIGIRIALGAQSRRVAAGVLRYGVVLGIIGVALGLPIALALGRTLEGMLFGVEARDPLTFVAVAALLLMSSLTASYFPARRASSVDPMVALRQE